MSLLQKNGNEFENHTGIKEHTTIYPTCPKCNGKGYLEKTEVWK